ncbi:hypothetical protein D3C84_1003240 [compost metagenome]
MHHAIGFQRAKYREIFQIFRAVDLTAVQEGGAGDHRHLRLTQASGDQQGVFVAQLPHAQGDVDALGHQVDPTIEQHDLQLNFRELCQEIADHVR